MQILWDEAKRQANLAKHGLDFGDLTMAFFEEALIRPGHDRRFMALGQVGEARIAAVVFRPLGSEAVSIISMRPASQRERRLYDQYGR